jgi:hypothetical protein
MQRTLCGIATLLCGLAILWIGAALATQAQAPAAAQKDLAACRAVRVTSLPGTHQFAADFIETIATDPDPRAKDANAIWAVTADLANTVPYRKRAIYISKSVDDGATWSPVARISHKYYDAKIGEGLRNGLAVSPGGTDFVITTQQGAFQVFPQPGSLDAIMKPIWGPRVPSVRPRIVIPKSTGDPVRAGVVQITADGKRMIVGFGYFDQNPQLFAYHRQVRGDGAKFYGDGHGSRAGFWTDGGGFWIDGRGFWIEDGPLPHLPNDLDIFSMEFDNPKLAHPRSLYVGTGDQAYRLDLRTRRWTEISGVGEDSAIHGMTTVGGLHLAACWGVYNPAGKDAVARVTHASFLLHPKKDVVGAKIRAYSIAVDPLRHNREVLTAITGVYISRDFGQTWRRLNQLAEGEFHMAHFNPDGSILVSGMVGTFLVNPFSNACGPRLQIRH